MSLIQSTAIPSGVATGYEIEQSLRFNDNDSAYLTRTPASAGNRRTWTWSGWVKRSELGSANGMFGAGNGGSIFGWLEFNSADQIKFGNYNSATNGLKQSTAVYRDTSAWYHIVAVYDSTDSTAADRMRLYVNGERLTSFSGSTDVNLNFEGVINNNIIHTVSGLYAGQLYNPFDGYIGEVNFIDGLAKAPADFGETGDYGEWKPIEYSGSYGTNGFYLPFKQDYTVEGFSTVVYRGNGGTQYIGGTGFQPDMLWVKERTSTSSHQIHDAIRGAGTALFTNANSAESSSSTYVSSFNTDGFNVGSSGSVNSASDNYVAWNWDMGGSNATNTAGSIQSTVRANTTYGQSIVSYTGNTAANITVGHGLNSAPELIFVKARGVVQNWVTYHSDLGVNKTVYLNATNAEITNTGYWGTVNASTWGAKSGGFSNNLSTTMIAYCFHSVTGYSKFGSYTGNGSSGKAITTGFAPAFVMTKRTDAVSNWIMWDNTRNPQNTADKHLLANSSSAEASATNPAIDFTSTGFELAGNDSSFNASGGSYIYISFADKREYAYWLDQSGNNNDWTSNNLTESDVMVDSPTNNFATMNPIDKASGTVVYSEGNLKVSVGDNEETFGSFGIEKGVGKYYFEMCHISSAGSNNKIGVGIGSAGVTANDEVVDYGHSGTTWGVGTIIGVAVNSTAEEVSFYKNNVIIGSAVDFSGKSWSHWKPIVTSANSAGEEVVTLNFGQDSSFAGAKTAQGNQDANDIGDFYYTPPTGFLALCTSNLPDVAVVPSEHFNTVLYTGTGSSNAITGVGFQPDFTWLKRRNGATSHRIMDAVRTVAKYLSSNVTNGEDNTTGLFGSFDSDGFTVTGTANAFNGSSQTYASWNWKANGSGSSNTNGSLNSTVSVNTDAGFSIVKYVGNQNSAQTIGHGLGVVPEMMIVKNTSRVKVWAVYHKDIGNEYVLDLSATTAKYDSNIRWNDTTPTSALFTVGTSDETNYTNDNHIAYCFHSVDGYSKVGSYTGNGNADGTFVYTGFRPAFVLFKRTDATNHWLMLDNQRDIDNPVHKFVLANEAQVEDTSNNQDVDYTSNGFKVRNSNARNNASGGSYIYIAFAETPFKYSNAR